MSTKQPIQRISVDEETLQRLFPIISRFIESTVDALVARSVGRYMNLPLSVDSVAHVLNENPKTIYKWIQRGRLTFTKKDGRNFITILELNKQLTNGEALDNLRQNLLETNVSPNNQSIYGQHI